MIEETEVETEEFTDELVDEALDREGAYFLPCAGSCVAAVPPCR
jgi:hypothetical protein